MDYNNVMLDFYLQLFDMSTITTTTHKYCFAPTCSNNSKRNSDKYFFRVPYNRNLRDRWCAAVGRANAIIKQASTAYCCSDHFNVRFMDFNDAERDFEVNFFFLNSWQ